ncbi:MAG: helix-turn-helix transcriptional regulator [Lachnospiraceae bacterium]|nr:helix-turn-helix transcriptional regulator [Lachnospiraceae bacterium]
MVDYSPLWETMKKKGISQYHLIKKCGIDNKTIYNIKRNENITLLTLEKLCIALDCTPDDIISFHP